MVRSPTTFILHSRIIGLHHADLGWFRMQKPLRWHNDRTVDLGSYCHALLLWMSSI